MSTQPTDEEIDAVTLEVLGYAALDKNTNETARLIARAVLAKWGQPAQTGDAVATQWLAEMIMSDCGCSTENQRLLDRIIDRIQQYDRASAAPQPSTAAQGDALSDAVRVPLDSLHADAAYLIGRLREGSMPYARVIEIISERIDAAKAAIRARAAHGQAPATVQADSVLEDAARYRWLRINAIGAFRTNDGKGPVSVYHLAKIPAIPGIPEETDAAIDAARKQGEKP